MDGPLSWWHLRASRVAFEAGKKVDEEEVERMEERAKMEEKERVDDYRAAQTDPIPEGRKDYSPLRIILILELRMSGNWKGVTAKDRPGHLSLVDDQVLDKLFCRVVALEYFLFVVPLYI